MNWFILVLTTTTSDGLRFLRPELELRRPCDRDGLAQGAHAGVVVALQRLHLLVDAGRAAQLRGERHDLKPAQHAVDTRDVATRVDLLSP